MKPRYMAKTIEKQMLNFASFSICNCLIPFPCSSRTQRLASRSPETNQLNNDEKTGVKVLRVDLFFEKRKMSFDIKLKTSIESQRPAQFTLYSSAMSSHSSTSTLRKTTSSMVLSISSRCGAIILQGPHQVAWKSTTTSLPPALANYWIGDGQDIRV